MTPFQVRLQQAKAYQDEIGSKKTYLYEVYTADYVGNSFTVILADTDDEAKKVAAILVPNAKWLRVDHWGKGPRIDLL